MTLRADERERIIRQQHARQEGWARWSRPSRYIAFLVIVVGLIVGIWFLLQESQEEVDPATLQIIRASEEPYKVKVDDQEILSVRHQDKLVYSRLHKGEGIPQVEHLLPEPEAPIALEAHGDDSIAEEPKTVIVLEGDEANQKMDSIASLIHREGMGETSGPFVQLATVKSEADAKREWTRLNRKHKDLLGQWTPLIEAVDLKEKGVMYRLRVGPYKQLADAKALAKDLKARKVGCLVIP